MTPSITPEPPSTPTYPLSALNLPSYPVFTSAAAATSGITNDADPTRPQKLWYDQIAQIVAANPSLDSDNITYPTTYQAPNASSLPVAGTISITFEQAAHLNFPTAAQMSAAESSPNADALLATPFYSGIDPVPNPARALLSTETIIWNPMPGGPVLVGNTANGYAPAGTAGSAGSDSGTMAAIYTMVSGIAEKLGVPVVPVS